MEFIIKDKELGECMVKVSDYSYSIVDAFIESGYSYTLERQLTDIELDRLQTYNMDWITDEIYGQGLSRNHN